VTTNEIRMRRVDVASLHTIQIMSQVHHGRFSCPLRNHIHYKLHHRLLKEVDHDTIEAFSKGWIPSESLL
jgi:hypothetical protein